MQHFLDLLLSLKQQLAHIFEHLGHPVQGPLLIDFHFFQLEVRFVQNLLVKLRLHIDSFDYAVQRDSYLGGCFEICLYEIVLRVQHYALAAQGLAVVSAEVANQLVRVVLAMGRQFCPLFYVFKGLLLHDFVGKDLVGPRV